MESESAARGKRYCLFPIRYPELFALYKRATSCFWTAEEVDLARDLKDYAELTDDERRYVNLVLAFFAGSDGIVIENLAMNFIRDVEAQEARCFYAFQAAIEAVHSEAYSLMIDTYVRSPAEKARLFDAVETVPCVRLKAEWAQRWMDPARNTFAERLIAFAAVEGVFFSSSFACVFWLKSRGKMPGFSSTNELVARDEGLHTEFAVQLYRTLVAGERPEAERVPQARAHEMMREVLAVERNFVEESIPVRLLGINADLMVQYVEYVADRLLEQLGFAPLYGHAECPLPYMLQISVIGKTNFFEGRNTFYTRGAAAAATVETADGGRAIAIDTAAEF